MDIPPFAEFIDSLDSHTVSGIMKDANIAAKLVESQQLLDPDDLIPLQVQSIAWQTALGLLGAYHTWLAQQP